MSAPFARQGYFPRDDDYYVILDVDFHASQETIVSAYRNLARKYHPDKHNLDERSRREAQVIFERIKTAYEVLSDPKRRRIYDTLGPDGLKFEEWKLVRKQMTAEEIREQYLRLQQTRLDEKMAIIAKPNASFTLSIDATKCFDYSTDDDESLDELELERSSFERLVDLVEVSSMSAAMSLNHDISIDHRLRLSGDINAKNGTGDGHFGFKYKYKHSPTSQFHLYTQFGGLAMIKGGYHYKISKQTTLRTSAFVIANYDRIIPGGEVELVHHIRKNLVGKITYNEDVKKSVSTSLIYVHEKLLIEMTTSYKLSGSSQSLALQIAHRFNRNSSKVSVSVETSTTEGIAVEYGCETRVLEINVVGASVHVGLSSGVMLKLKYSRANQSLSVPIFLCDEIYPAPIFYATAIPLIAYYLLDRCYLKNYKKS